METFFYLRTLWSMDRTTYHPPNHMSTAALKHIVEYTVRTRRQFLWVASSVNPTRYGADASPSACIPTVQIPTACAECFYGTIHMTLLFYGDRQPKRNYSDMKAANRNTPLLLVRKPSTKNGMDAAVSIITCSSTIHMDSRRLRMFVGCFRSLVYLSISSYVYSSIF
uniref:Uncharacterized protein n=1 Tax=Lygus hesperus TaxID=30085 RepID=A0A146LEN9_LYGHE